MGQSFTPRFVRVSRFKKNEKKKKELAVGNSRSSLCNQWHGGLSHSGCVLQYVHVFLSLPASAIEFFLASFCNRYLFIYFVQQPRVNQLKRSHHHIP
ncbi:MAG TPA: hypothetical protein VGO47_09840, partial [Chlamydiales bacterium]|nr:hypothetical protein [Chlamydiales bacterium]